MNRHRAHAPRILDAPRNRPIQPSGGRFGKRAIDGAIAHRRLRRAASCRDGPLHDSCGAMPCHAAPSTENSRSANGRAGYCARLRTNRSAIRETPPARFASRRSPEPVSPRRAARATAFQAAASPAAI
ncbi:hypothetical protein DF122_31610 [Burkholderia pseudomallei]|nr:hypothetical protein BOC35_18195 [Burkholderia pseudomallei]ARL24822.1 hypothetical protein BOC47_09550 [Burkholderia pseudomallei]ARL31643.1 hypothetical protein BOC48_05405 [Burkholderia pseudomallei]ARL74767.1 hypothetical protein BOC54_12755 [Burkholderia pseudomallei]ARL79955.1 hypothetical protein BOC55_11895 [Burkholderia pseudomallei]